jgi:UDP-3-O-[3-hydroxymyristoyl] glucosamine N-acyltransferase
MESCLSAKQIANFLNAELIGPDVEIREVQAIGTNKEHALYFINRYDEKFIKIMNQYKNVLIICSQEYAGRFSVSHILCANPRLFFLRVVNRFFCRHRDIEPKISEHAVVHPEASIGELVSIGAFSVIGPEVCIGDGTVIGNNVSIDGAVSIGKGCVIKSGAVIGEAGFGFEYNEDGVPEHFPHIGGVVIGDYVNIGACTCIERATLAVTRVMDYVKVDDLVQIGHNSETGESTMIMAGSIVGGGTKVGAKCWIAPKTVLKEKIVVNDGAMTGFGSVVIKDVPTNAVVAGVPAKIIKYKK